MFVFVMNALRLYVVVASEKETKAGSCFGAVSREAQKETSRSTSSHLYLVKAFESFVCLYSPREAFLPMRGAFDSRRLCAMISNHRR